MGPTMDRLTPTPRRIITTSTNPRCRRTALVEPQYLNVGLRKHTTVVGSDAFGEKLIVGRRRLDPRVGVKKWERGWTVAEPMVLDKTIPNKNEIVFFEQRPIDYKHQIPARGRWLTCLRAPCPKTVDGAS